MLALPFIAARKRTVAPSYLGLKKQSRWTGVLSWASADDWQPEVWGT